MENLPYSTFSLEAGRSRAQYANTANRGWGSEHDTVESFLRALIGRGFSEQWLRLGVGEPKSGITGPERIVEREELPAADARDRVIDALLADGVTDDAGVAYKAVRSIAFQHGDELALYREARKLIERERRPDKPRLGERSARSKGKT